MDNNQRDVDTKDFNTKDFNTKDFNTKDFNTKDFNLDYTSENPLEEELLRLNLITENQYDFIRQFQKAFLRHRELNSSIQLTKVRTAGGRIKNQIEDIVDDSREYWGYLNKLGDKSANILEHYFCSNMTMKRLKDKYTKKEVIKEIIQKKKKNKNKNKKNNNNNNENNSNENNSNENNSKIITKEIERIKEHFDEAKLVDELTILFKVLDRIEWITKKEGEEKRKMIEKEIKEKEKEKETIIKIENETMAYEIMIEKLKKLTEKEGKIKIFSKLKINHKLFNRILAGDKKYSFEVYEKIKKILR
jgi:hypothetical protein